MRVAIVALGLAILLVFTMTGVAGADPGGNPNENADFGQHHADHARDGDLGQDMNPGMHQGKAGWDPEHPH